MNGGSPRPEIDLDAWAIDMNARFEDTKQYQDVFNRQLQRRVKRGSDRIDRVDREIDKLKTRWAASAYIAGSVVAVVATGLPFFWKWLFAE